MPLSNVLGTNFSLFDLIMIADDTGSLNQWGTAGSTAAQVDKIANPVAGKPASKPIIGLGEGGYAFFGQLSMYIGWPRGWHGPQGNLRAAAAAPADFFTGISHVSDPIIPFYTAPTNSVGIYTLGPTPPANVTPIGLEDPLDDHASLIQEGCNLLWGNSGNPLGMASDGQIIFLNSVAYMLQSSCNPPVTTPPDACFTLQKTATPDATATVSPGLEITYTLTYKLIGSGCPTQAKLIDVVPFGTTYVPGSADDSTRAARGRSRT